MPGKQENEFPRIELRPGYSVSRVIKGGWQLAGGHGEVDEKQALHDMWAFVEAGIDTFDCADIYTGVEELIGKFVKQNKQVQIHTKYVPDLDELPRLTRNHTEKIIDRSLMRLGVERLDLVQFHWWDYTIPGYIDAAFHLADLQRAGKIRYIGVTNFDAVHLKELLDAGIPVVADQVQYSVLDHRPEGALIRLTREYGLALLCYGTLAGGYLNERYLGLEDLPDPPENRSLVKYRLIIEEFGGSELFRPLLYTLAEIAGRYGVGIAEIAAKYILQMPGVAAVILGARNADHLEKIKSLRTLSLTAEDIEVIHAVTDKARGPAGPVYGLERDREGAHGRIMKYNLNEQ